MSSSFYRRQKEHDRAMRRYGTGPSRARGGSGGEPQQQQQQQQAAAPQRTVYTVTEGREGKSFWTRVGVGFENRDGSLNLILDALPVNGRLQVRAYEAEPDRDARDRGDGGGGADHAA